MLLSRTAFGKPREETNSVHEGFKQKLSLSNNLNCLHLRSLLNMELPLSYLTFGMVFCSSACQLLVRDV